MDILDLRGDSKIESLNLKDPSDRPRTTQPQPQPKNPGVAFLLSLVLPGAGQAYCGEARRGWWTFFFFALSAAGVIGLKDSLSSGNENAAMVLWGVCLRTGLAVYAFAFLDAFFTAREMSAGAHSLLPYNPRLATILNLTTRGFGYWYLDEKKKGVALFVLIGIADRVARRAEDPAATWLGIGVELALAGLALDAYRLAKKKNQPHLESILPSASAMMPVSGFNPGIPVALAGLIGMAYAGLIAIGLAMPDYEKIDQSRARITQGESVRSYVNPKYGVELHVPADWELDNKDEGFLVEASKLGGSCSANLMVEGWLPIPGPMSYGDEFADGLLKNNPNYRLLDRKAATLGGLAAQELILAINVEGTEVRQRCILARKGLSVYTLILTTTGPLDEACAGDIEKIHQRLVLPK